MMDTLKRRDYTTDNKEELVLTGAVDLVKERSPLEDPIFSCVKTDCRNFQESTSGNQLLSDHIQLSPVMKRIIIAKQSAPEKEKAEFDGQLNALVALSAYEDKAFIDEFINKNTDNSVDIFKPQRNISLDNLLLITPEHAVLIEKTNNIKRLKPKYGTVNRVNKNDIHMTFLDKWGNESDMIINKDKVNLKGLNTNDRVSLNIIKFSNYIRYWFELLPRITPDSGKILETIESLNDIINFDEE